MKSKTTAKTLRFVAAMLCIAAAVIFLLPIGFGILQIGMLYPAAGFVLLALFLIFFEPVIAFLKAHRVLTRILCVLIALGILILAIPLCLMVSAERDTAEDENAVLIVLGCQVRGTQPSLMLTARCRTAQDYLEAHPNAMCITSGGQGSGEDISEADAIKTYLVSHGIAPERVFIEADSENTFQNIRNSAAVLKENGLGNRVVIASDGFHQFRAKFFSRQFGLDSSACSCRTLWVLAPGYWAREILAVWKALVFKG